MSRAEEVIDEVGPLRLSLPGSADADPAESLGPEAALVYAALPAVGTRRADDLAQQCGLVLPAVRAALPALELAGLVATDDGGWYRTQQRRAGRGGV